MANEIVELIAENIKTTLAAVVVASGQAWENTLTVKREAWDPDATAPDDRLVVVAQGDADPKEEGRPQGKQSWDQWFNVQAYAIKPETTTTAIDTELNSIAADIEAALMADRTRGGHAVNTKPGKREIEYLPADHAYMIRCWFKVECRTAIGNPRSL